MRHRQLRALRLLGIALAIAVLAASGPHGGPSLLRVEAAAAAPTPGYGSQPVWRDEFTSLSLDVAGTGGANWAPRFRVWRTLALDGNSDKCVKEHEGYTGKGGPPLNVRLHAVHDGVVSLYGRRIPANRREQFWGYEAICGMLDGSGSHGQTYGYWEVRFRMASLSAGQQVSIWLTPTDGAWPPELDLVEAVGTNRAVPTAERNRFRFAGHYLGVDGLPADEFVYPTVRRPEGWHEAGIDWRPDRVTWYLDGQEVFRLPGDKFGTEPMSLMITPEVSSNWAGPTGNATSWPLEVQVDYVRIYQLQGAQPPG